MKTINEMDINREWYDRLVAETEGLANKLDKLERFIDSDKFCELNKENRALLSMQKHAMISYMLILNRRIEINRYKV
jgi:hypothetical protein